MIKKYKKIGLFLVSFLLIVLTGVFCYAGSSEVPNQIIAENPYKEVNTIKANKNREHAELKITVNKINPESITAYKIGPNQYCIQLTSEGLTNESETYYISKNIEDLQNINKKKITTLNKFNTFFIDTGDFSYKIKDGIVFILKAPLQLEKFVMFKINKTSGEVQKAYNVDNIENINILDLEGERTKDNSKIIFKLNDKELEDFVDNKNDIKIGKNINEIFNKDKTKKIDIQYEIDKENKQLIVYNDGDIQELKIVLFKQNKVKSVYNGKIEKDKRVLIKIENKNIVIPQNEHSTEKMLIDQEFNVVGQGAIIQSIRIGNRTYNKESYPKENYIAGNILVETDDTPNTGYIRFHRVGGYVPNTKSYVITIRLKRNTDIIERVYMITEYPQKNVIVKPLNNYKLQEDVISNEQGTYYTDKLNVEEYIENQKASWEQYLGLKTILPTDNAKLVIQKMKEVVINKDGVLAELKTTGFKDHIIGSKIGSTRIVDALTGTYKMIFSSHSSGKLRLEIDGRVLSGNNGKRLKLYDNEVYLGDEMYKAPIQKPAINLLYKKMLKVQNNFSLRGEVDEYTEYVGRTILGKDNEVQNISGVSGTGTRVNMTLGLLKQNFNKAFSVSLFDFDPGKKEHSSFRYNTKDGKVSTGEIEILVGTEKTLDGSGSIDLTKFVLNEYRVCNSNELNNLVGDYINGNSLNEFSINNIRFKISPRKGQGEVIEKTIGDPSNVEVPEFLELSDSKLPFSIKITNQNKLEIKKLKNEDFNYNVEINYNYRNIPLGVFRVNITNTKSFITEYTSNINYNMNKPLIIQGDKNNNFYGWNVVYPISSADNNSVIGILNANNTIETSGKKNGQFKALEVSGQTTALKDSDIGKEITISVNEQKQKVTLDQTSNVMEIKEFQLAGLTVYVDYESVNTNNGGLRFAFANWDKQAKKIKIKVEFTDRINTYNISIGAFDPEIYYNKKIYQDKPTNINYELKTLEGNFIRDHTGHTQIKFNVGTSDYDLKILGKDNDNASSLNIKIPKTIILKVRDDKGTEKQISFSTDITIKYNGILKEDSHYYYIYPASNGVNNSESNIYATVRLMTMFKAGSVSWNYIVGENLKLVSVGSKIGADEKYSTIIDNVNLKMELANFNERIDVSNIKNLEKVYSTKGYYGLIQEENKIVLKELDGNREIFRTTFKELTTTEQEISEAGVSIKYNYGSIQDVHKNQFEFKKINGVDYNKTLRLEIQTSNGQLLYYIDFTIINKADFELLPDRGRLDFGDLFPGDVKTTEALIAFKNPTGAKINVELNPKNVEKMFRKGSDPITENTTIPLSNLRIKDLQKGPDNTNTFKISGTATTNENTVPGDYKGEIEVIITVVP